ncbi:low temperature requirement protein A [Chloroflexi bacterium TSY]|nr:low temperature requirement protein A [Chloroflexi bacterium TSY]
MSELFTPPKYFQDVKFHRHTDRTIGWLELFYDLVYVATLIQIGNFLSDNLTLLGFGQFLVMIFVIWWAWTGETFYQNRFVVDDIWHRLLVFIQIFGVAAIGLSVSEAFGDLYVQFTLGYVVVRFVLILMYVRSYTAHPESKSFSVQYMIGFAGGIAIWLGSLLLPTEYHWVGWLVAIAFEITFFSNSKMIQQLVKWGADAHHMVERFGIFIIIVLGEAFVKILDDAQGTALGIEQILFGVVGLGILCALWWLYFSDTAGKLYDISSNLKPLSWSYGHLFLVASLVSFGVAAKKLFGETVKHPTDPLTEEYRLLHTVAITIFLVALALINYGLDNKLTPKNQIINVLLYLAAAGVIVAVGLLVTGVTATQFVAIIAVIMVALVAFNIYETVTAPEHPHTS